MSLTEASRILEEQYPRGVDPKRFHAHCSRLKRIVILRTSWYPEVIDALVLSAKKYLLDNKVPASAIEVLHVPGSFELPLAAELCLSSQGAQVVDAVIALGCVVKGSTPHFQFVCDSMSQGLMSVSVKHKKPIGFGVLTVDNLDQALARKDKGAEAAQAALAMSLFRDQLEHHPLDHKTHSSSLTLDRSDLESR